MKVRLGLVVALALGVTLAGLGFTLGPNLLGSGGTSASLVEAAPALVGEERIVMVARSGREMWFEGDLALIKRSLGTETKLSNGYLAVPDNDYNNIPQVLLERCVGYVVVKKHAYNSLNEVIWADGRADVWINGERLFDDLVTGTGIFHCFTDNGEQVAAAYPGMMTNFMNNLDWSLVNGLTAK